MNETKRIPVSLQEFSTLSQSWLTRAIALTQNLTWRKLRGGVLLVIGYLLSPLCWWNDLIINLPIAYGFGHLCSLLASNLLIPGAIAGYWLSNIVGIMLMQTGVLTVWREQSSERNFKQELINGILTSTAYTALIVILLQCKILETPFFQQLALFNF
ncbi:MAG: hypothetical protein ACRC2J_06755 [Microcoleaceae cyanobacterium]